MDCVRRINLKTDCRDRKDLLQYCLENDAQQYVAIGWSYVYRGDGNAFDDYKSFYYAVERSVREQGKRINHALNSFWYVEEGDLFWTRDLDGFYWICRAKGKAEPCYDTEKDIGAVVPVRAFRYGLEIPGQIKASFNRPNGGIVEEIRDQIIINYSKFIFNQLAQDKVYRDIEKKEGNLINNLPDFDLEELVICYLQIKENYYVLSNSIANKSTTIGIECELMSRNKENPKKAVVQVKAKEGYIEYDQYGEFVKQGYIVFLYDGGQDNNDVPDGYSIISRENLEAFYYEYKTILPNSITKWECLFDGKG